MHLSEEKKEENYHLIRGLVYLLGWVAALEFLHLTAPVNNPAASSIVSLFWFLLTTISISTTWYIRSGRAGRHFKVSPSMFG